MRRPIHMTGQPACSAENSFFIPSSAVTNARGDITRLRHLPGQIKARQHGRTVCLVHQVGVGDQSGHHESRRGFDLAADLQTALDCLCEGAPGIDDLKHIVGPGREHVGQGAEHAGADIVAAHIEDQQALVFCDCATDFRQYDREVGRLVLAVGVDHPDSVPFHVFSRLSAAEIGVYQVEIYDGHLFLLRELDGEIHGHFGLAGAVVTHNHKDSVFWAVLVVAFHRLTADPLGVVL